MDWVRISNVHYLYINGSLEDTTTFTGNINLNSGSGMRFGGGNWDGLTLEAKTDNFAGYSISMCLHCEAYGNMYWLYNWVDNWKVT